jgi:hypothetical protein
MKVEERTDFTKRQLRILSTLIFVPNWRFRSRGSRPETGFEDISPVKPASRKYGPTASAMPASHPISQLRQIEYDECIGLFSTVNVAPARGRGEEIIAHAI